MKNSYQKVNLPNETDKGYHKVLTLICEQIVDNYSKNEFTHLITNDKDYFYALNQNLKNLTDNSINAPISSERKFWNLNKKIFLVDLFSTEPEIAIEIPNNYWKYLSELMIDLLDRDCILLLKVIFHEKEFSFIHFVNLLFTRAIRGNKFYNLFKNKPDEYGKKLLWPITSHNLINLRDYMPIFHFAQIIVDIRVIESYIQMQELKIDEVIKKFPKTTKNFQKRGYLPLSRNEVRR